MSTKADELIRRGEVVTRLSRIGAGGFDSPTPGQIENEVNAIPATTPALTGSQMERVRDWDSIVGVFNSAYDPEWDRAAELEDTARHGSADRAATIAGIKAVIDKLVAEERTLTEGKG